MDEVIAVSSNDNKDADTTLNTMMEAQNLQWAMHYILSNDEVVGPNDEVARYHQFLVDSFSAHLKVGAGMSSEKQRIMGFPGKAGLMTPEMGQGYIRKGVEYLEVLLDGHDKIDFFSYGACTNLASILKRRPELGQKIVLTQMGPNFFGIQYNVRMDPEAFSVVMQTVPEKYLVVSETTWGAYGTDHLSRERRQRFGIYPNDPFYRELKRRSDHPAFNIVVAHLDAWTTGFSHPLGDEEPKPCTITHDLLTTLSRREKGSIPFTKETLWVNAQGKVSRESLGATQFEAYVSGKPNEPLLKKLICKHLFNMSESEAVALSQEWTEFNRSHYVNGTPVPKAESEIN